MHTLAVVFLAVIALTSLLQAGAAVAAAIAARRLGRRIDDIEARFDRDLPALARIGRVVARAADASERALSQAQSLDRAVEGVARRASAAVDRVARGVEERVADSVGKVEDEIDNRIRRAGRPLARAAALVQGLRRGVTVWRERGTRPPSDEAEPPHVA